MWTFITIIAVLYIMYKIGGDTKSKKNTNYIIDKTASAKQLVDRVYSVDDYKKLIRKEKQAYKEASDDGFENKKLQRIAENYEKAVEKAGDKVFHMQYLPELSYESSRTEIENAFRIESIYDFETIKNEIGGDKNDWVEISVSEYLEEGYETKPDSIQKLIEYKDIVESVEYSYDEKVKILNEFGIHNAKDLSEYFYHYDLKNLGGEWMFEELSRLKIPMLNKLFELGYNTPDKIINISFEELKSINGFGDKRLKEIESIISKMKRDYKK